MVEGREKKIWSKRREMGKRSGLGVGCAASIYVRLFLVWTLYPRIMTII